MMRNKKAKDECGGSVANQSGYKVCRLRLRQPCYPREPAPANGMSDK